MTQVFESRLIKTSLLVQNDGRIPGVPANPRYIRKDKFESLKRNIEQDPKFLYTNELKVFEYEGKFVVISGNMRLRACKQIGIKEIPCKIIPQDWTAEDINKEAIYSNVESGEWDTEMLANEWGEMPWKDWGVDVPGMQKDDEQSEDEEEIKQQDNTKTECQTCPTCGKVIDEAAPF
jgi:hypothetical protein